MDPKKKFKLSSIFSVLNYYKHIIYQSVNYLNIIGIRSLNSKSNDFDDSLNVFYRDKYNNWIFEQFMFTTDPGRRTLINPINPDGTAILVSGQYIYCYCIGLHRNKYTALVQRLGGVKVFRDKNKDDNLDFDSTTMQFGSYGINIHRASSSGVTPAIEGYSAGCQVFANILDFNHFMGLCNIHKLKFGNKFTYTLLNEQMFMDYSKLHNVILD